MMPGGLLSTNCGSLNTAMRIQEVIRPQSPEQQRIAALKANRDRASQALKAERDRQRLSRAQQSLRRAQQVASPKPNA